MDNYKKHFNNMLELVRVLVETENQDPKLLFEQLLIEYNKGVLQGVADNLLHKHLEVAIKHGIQLNVVKFFTGYKIVASFKDKEFSLATERAEEIDDFFEFVKTSLK